MILDTKFRRENSNFKIKYTDGVYIPDPNSENPTEPIKGLLQILPKNLGPEDFMGMIATKEVPLGSSGMNAETSTTILTVEGADVMGWQLYAPEFAATIHGGQASWVFNQGTYLIYYPSTGYLVDNTYEDPS